MGGGIKCLREVGSSIDHVPCGLGQLPYQLLPKLWKSSALLLTVCRKPHQLYCRVVEAFTVSLLRLLVNRERKGGITVSFRKQIIPVVSQGSG